MPVPEPQQGVLRWIVLALVAAAFVALAMAGSQDSDDEAAARIELGSPLQG